MLNRRKSPAFQKRRARQSHGCRTGVCSSCPVSHSDELHMSNITHLGPMAEAGKGQLEPIVAQLQNSRSIFISAHATAHGGALCGMLALGLALKSSQKHVRMHYKVAIPPKFSFLPSVNDVDRTLDLERNFDTVVVLNYTESDNANIADVLHKRTPTVISIDPHQANTSFGDCQFVDPAASGSTEMVYRIIEQLPAGIDCQIATAIYTGIQTDTGSFRFKNTNPASFGICAELIPLGVNPQHVARQLYGTYPLGHIRLLERALDSMEITHNGKVSVMTLTREVFQETGTRPQDMDGMMDCASQIKGVKVTAVIKEVDPGWTCSIDRQHSYHVSLYSENGVNVADIAARFGGSGSARSAGFHTTTTLSELKAHLAKISESIGAPTAPKRLKLSYANSPTTDRYPVSSDDSQLNSF